MMMSDLPLDLVEEILSRVPATSVKRLRSTCKRWNALFKDQRFTEKHFRRAPKESMVLMLNEYKDFSMSDNLNDSTPSSIEFQGVLGLKDSHSNSEQVEITEVFHCDGLLLCSTNDNRLVVWNPCLGESRWIQHKTGYDSSSRFTLGYIQTNKSYRSYKILRRWGNYNDKWFEIYEFSSDSWRVLDDVVLDFFIIRNGYRSAASSLEGNTYWLAFNKKGGHQFILSFDFTTERFKHMCLPPFQNHGIVTLSVGREEQLSALNWSYNSSKIEMWLTNKIDADQSELLWSKSFIVDIPIVCKWFSIFTSLLIDAEKKVSLCCIENPNGRNLVYTVGEDYEYYTEIPYIKCQGSLYSQKWRPVIFNYVPSLVQIKKAEKKTSK